MRQVFKCDLTYVVDNVERISALPYSMLLKRQGLLLQTLEVPYPFILNP